MNSKEKLSELLLRKDSKSPPAEYQVEDRYREEIDELVAGFEKVLGEGDADSYSALHLLLSEKRSDLRESVQALTRGAIRRVIVELQTGQALSDEDVKLIRLWLVGDADAYVAEENNFENWLLEFQRLSDEIQKLRNAEITPETLIELQALLTDARGVSIDISNYMSNRERVEHFEETMRSELGDSRRKMLANILMRSYESSEE